MSNKIADDKIAMLIELRQMLEDGHYTIVVDKTAELISDEHLSSGNALAVRLLSIRGNALYKLSRFEESLDLVRRALEMIKCSSDNELISELQSIAARDLAELGRTSEAEREYRDLISTYRRMDDSLGVIRSLNRISRIHFIKGQYAKAIDYLLEASDYACAIGDLKWQAMITGNMGTILNLSGEFHKALEYVNESLDHNRALKNNHNIARGYLSQAFALMHLRRFEEAESSLTRAESILESTPSRSDSVTLLQYRAQILLLAGDCYRAVEIASEALQLANLNSSISMEGAQVGRILAEAHLELGHDAEAGVFAETALQIAEQLGERVEIAACRRILVTIKAHGGDARLVDAEFASVTRALDEIGSRYELAMAYQAWSQVTSKTAEVREYRSEADRILRSLGIEIARFKLPAKAVSESPVESQLIGEHPEFLQIVQQIDAVADSEIPVLLLGETGVGKDQIARYLHHNSSHRKGKLIQVNCGAIPLELAESHFFGHDRGAFTHAVDTKIGFLEAATGGTLFLNEVGELPLAIQVKLLSALEEKTFYRVGGTTPREVNFRIVAATNVDLDAAVKSGRFRSDLFYRIAVMTITVPRLAQRSGDTYKLFEHFMEIEGAPVRHVDRRTLDQVRIALEGHSWIGNVRELRNVVRLYCITEKRDARSVCLRLLNKISVQTYPGSPTPLAQESMNLNVAVEALEKSAISSALSTCGGTIRRAANHLGLPEATLRSKMKKYRISPA